MNSSEHNSPFHKRSLPDTSGRQPSAWQPAPYQTAPYQSAPYQPVAEDNLAGGEIQIERKTFHMALKENLRGRLLRITEQKGHIRETIIIPATGLKDFQRLLAEMIAEDQRIPVKTGQDAPPTPPPAGV
jgi:hypothetical protein